jgi:hypothetical protein
METYTAEKNFRFEEDFVEDGMRCIPMAVRFKLDRCGIKLKLSEWSRMNELERHHLAESPCATSDEILVYRAWLRHTIYKRTGTEAAELPTSPDPVWSETMRIPECVQNQLDELGIPMTLDQWNGLPTLQRFALVKLSRPGHENRNFPIALREFLEPIPSE